MVEPNQLPRNSKAFLSPSTRPQKRRKTKHSQAFESEAPDTAQAHPDLQKPTVTLSTPQEATIISGVTALPPEILPPALYHLQHKYALATMSIISSSKINQKVRALISHMERFSFADLNAKPGVVILHAKANVASKMISVVEIAKRQIEEEKGRWWQYCGVQPLLEELRAREKKKDTLQAEGRTIKQWQEGQKSGPFQGNDETEEVASKPEARKADNVVSTEETMEVEEDVGEEAFQTMTNVGNIGNGATAHEILARPKVRATPIMSIYMARVPVPELKERYGYVQSMPRMKAGLHMLTRYLQREDQRMTF